jgi:protein TonB
MTAVPMPVSSVTVQASAPVQAAAVQAAPIVAIPQPKITHEAVVEQKAPEAVIAVKPALHIAAATPNHADSAVEAPTLNLAASAAMPEFAAPKAPAATLAVKKSTATPSEAIHTVAPAYPETARRNGITGNVRLQLTISAAGKVTNVKVLDGPVILQPAAVAAARQWVYRPAMLDGRPTESTSELVVKFAR